MHSGKKWNRDHITWGVSKFSSKIRPFHQWKAFRRAFKAWAKHGPLRFSYRRFEPDIEILFARREHGDGIYNAFDGEGKVLAHAFRPNSGDTHFDEDEKWTLKIKNKKRAVNLLSVAIHEFGHALGLEHTSDYDSVMSPYFTKLNFKLQRRDIIQLQSMYGRKRARKRKKKIVPRRKKHPLPKVKVKNILKGCEGIGDLFKDADGNVNVLIKNMTIILDNHGRNITPITWISNVYAGLHDRYDAATHIKDTKTTYLFKDDKVWKATRHYVDVNFPKVVKFHRKYEPPKACLTFNFRHSSRVLLFGNHLFWEWSPSSDTVTSRNPMAISRYWKGVPNGVEAAIQWRDTFVYFFKGNMYYKVSPRGREVLHGYPKPMPPPWLRHFCKPDEK